MDRTTEIVTKEFTDASGKTKKVKVKLFPWEELDGVEDLTEVFQLK
jgi:hypothetical protein